MAWSTRSTNQMCQRCGTIHFQDHLSVCCMQLLLCVIYIVLCILFSMWCHWYKNQLINFSTCFFVQFYRFGCAKRLVSDQGREFINKINTELQQLLGTQHRMTSAYHPQTNGLVEKFNHTIQSCLLKVVNDCQDDWDLHLDPVLFAIRTSKHKSTGYTPYELVYKRWECMIDAAMHRFMICLLYLSVILLWHFL